MLDQMRPRRRKKEPEDFAEVPKRRRGRPAVRLRERSKRLRAVTGRAKILHVEKLEESIESDEVARVVRGVSKIFTCLV